MMFYKSKNILHEINKQLKIENVLIGVTGVFGSFVCIDYINQQIPYLVLEFQYKQDGKVIQKIHNIGGTAVIKSIDIIPKDLNNSTKLFNKDSLTWNQSGILHYNKSMKVAELDDYKDNMKIKIKYEYKMPLFGYLRREKEFNV